MNALRSSVYVAGAKGQPCSFGIAGVCQGGTDTTVFCHIRDRHTGRSIKASDISGGDGCFSCHEVFDLRAKMPDGNLITDLDWAFYALRALQRTLENRVQRGILPFPHDPAPKPGKAPSRKAGGKSRSIQSGPTNWPSAKIPSRKMRS